MVARLRLRRAGYREIAFDESDAATLHGDVVPVPMAMPTSAWAKAGASLIPSPPWRRLFLPLQFADDV